MKALALSFPTLEAAAGVSPWNPEALDAWAADGASSGAVHAAAFVLGVWDSEGPWRVGPFDLFAAMASWDETHRAAFRAWVTEPWWP